MATSYKTPGVFIEEIPKLPPSVAQVETAIPAFIGYTQRQGTATEPLPKVAGSSTLAEPLRITSLMEYETYFGTARAEVFIIMVDEVSVPAKAAVPEVEATATEPAIPAVPARPAINSLAVKASLPAPSIHTMYYHMQLYFSNGGGPCYIVSVGLDSVASDTPPTTAPAPIVDTELLAGLDALRAYDEPTLIVFPQGSRVSDEHKRYDLYKAALKQAADLGDRFVIMDAPVDAAGKPDPGFRGGIGNNNLKYGAAYFPELRTALPYLYDEATLKVSYRRTTNDEDFDDAAGTPAQPDETVGNKVFSDFAARTDIQAAIRAEMDKLPRLTLPPSAAIAGIYAYVDSTSGVWKAPANVSLARVVEPSVRITDAEQDDMNVHDTGKSINAIRAFTGKGTLVWGARTLAGNDNEWRYVPVRRFFNMVEESSKKATQPFVFEPNDANTWVKVQGMLENFLTTLWRQGALQGAKPEHAFYVAVGLNKTMTAPDILEGRMIVEIGMAVVRPAEFIILRFSHRMAES